MFDVNEAFGKVRPFTAMQIYEEKMKLNLRDIKVSEIKTLRTIIVGVQIEDPDLKGTDKELPIQVIHDREFNSNRVMYRGAEAWHGLKEEFADQVAHLIVVTLGKPYMVIGAFKVLGGPREIVDGVKRYSWLPNEHVKTIDDNEWLEVDPELTSQLKGAALTDFIRKDGSPDPNPFNYGNVYTVNFD